jgi:hypothetical protein
MELRPMMKIPEAWRLLRIAWRPKRIAAVATVSLTVCLLIVGYLLLARYVTHGARPQNLAESLCVAMMIYLGLLWIIILPGQVSYSLSSEFAIGTWLFQQTTPQSVRKLLLGKLIGASGDVYIATAIGLPFLVASWAMSGLAIDGVISSCLFIFVFSMVLCTFTFYYAAIAGKKLTGSVGVSIIILIGLTFLYGAASGIGAKSAGSVVNLHPFIAAGSPFSKAAGITFVYFFGREIPTILMANVLYGLAALWFFFAAESQIRRTMTIPMSRSPLFAAFILLEFFITGFCLNGAFRDSKWYEVCLYVFNFFNLFFLYFVILNNSLPLSDLKPWLYHLRQRKLSAQDLFRGDAPAIFTVAVLLIIVSLGAFALPALHGDSDIMIFQTKANPGFESMTTIVLIQISLILVIVLRDAFFFQACRIYFKRGKEVALVIYILVFGAIPGMVAVKAGDKQFLDLSPTTALLSPAVIKEWHNLSTLYYSYLSVNGLLLVVFAILTLRLLKNAQQDLPAELVKQ